MLEIKDRTLVSVDPRPNIRSLVALDAQRDPKWEEYTRTVGIHTVGPFPGTMPEFDKYVW